MPCILSRNRPETRRAVSSSIYTSAGELRGSLGHELGHDVGVGFVGFVAAAELEGEATSGGDEGDLGGLEIMPSSTEAMPMTWL